MCMHEGDAMRNAYSCAYAAQPNLAMPRVGLLGRTFESSPDHCACVSGRSCEVAWAIPRCTLSHASTSTRRVSTLLDHRLQGWCRTGRQKSVKSKISQIICVTRRKFVECMRSKFANRCVLLLWCAEDKSGCMMCILLVTCLFD
jgi:hypothetical protein